MSKTELELEMTNQLRDYRGYDKQQLGLRPKQHIQQEFNTNNEDEKKCYQHAC